MNRNLLAALAIFLMSSTVEAGEVQVKIAVSELSCPSCVFIVKSAMLNVPTVEVLGFEEGVDWWEGVFLVSYDDDTATPEMIAEAVMDYGYPASVVTELGS